MSNAGLTNAEVLHLIAEEIAMLEDLRAEVESAPLPSPKAWPYLLPTNEQ